LSKIRPLAAAEAVMGPGREGGQAIHYPPYISEKNHIKTKNQNY
jgi:hypothetical protein